MIRRFLRISLVATISLVTAVMIWGIWYTYVPVRPLQPWCETKWRERYLGADLSPEFMQVFVNVIAGWHRPREQSSLNLKSIMVVSGNRIYMSGADLHSSAVLNFMSKMPANYARSHRHKNLELAKLLGQMQALEGVPGDRGDKRASRGAINCRILEIMLKQ